MTVRAGWRAYGLIRRGGGEGREFGGYGRREQFDDWGRAVGLPYLERPPSWAQRQCYY